MQSASSSHTARLQRPCACGSSCTDVANVCQRGCFFVPLLLSPDWPVGGIFQVERKNMPPHWARCDARSITSVPAARHAASLAEDRQAAATGNESCNTPTTGQSPVYQLSMQWLRDGITETMQTQRFWSQGLIARFGVHGRRKSNRAAAHPQVIAKRVTSATMHGRHKSTCAAAHTQVIVKRTMLAKLHGRHKSTCATAHTQVIVKRTMLNDLCRLRLGTL